MQRYPWLIKIYKQIILQYKKGTAHHAIVINTQRGMGVLNLLLAVTRWLLCTHKNNITSCGVCHNCNLISYQNHPDWHFIKKPTGKKMVGIDTIRDLIKKIFYTSQQGGAKVIWLPEISSMTESAIFSLLKTLEEPPKNTWFFLINYNFYTLHSTIMSRFFKYVLYPPEEDISIKWLKDVTDKKKILCLTALRISSRSPITAKKLIMGSSWLERKEFFIKLNYAIKNYNLLILLSYLKEKTFSITLYIDWIYILLLDVIKWKYQLFSSLINLDQRSLIRYLAWQYPVKFLYESIILWIQCKKKLINVIGINYELLIVKILLEWEKFMISYKK